MRHFIPFFCIFVFCTLQAFADAPERVLYFSLSAGYVHSPVNGQPSLSDRVIADITKNLGITVDCTQDGKVFDGDVSQYAAFIFQTSGDLTKGGKGQPDRALTDAGWKNLLNVIRSGKGFLGFHPTTDSNRTGGDHYTNNPDDKVTEFSRFIGAEFTLHGEHQDSTVIVPQPSPFAYLFNKGSRYQMFEEWYCHKNFQKDIRVFALCDTAGMRGNMYKRPPFPIVWGRAEGKGRVLYSAFGHYDQYWLDKGNQEFIGQLIQAAIGTLKVDLSPNIDKVAPGANVLKQ